MGYIYNVHTWTAWAGSAQSISCGSTHCLWAERCVAAEGSSLEWCLYTLQHSCARQSLCLTRHICGGLLQQVLTCECQCTICCRTWIICGDSWWWHYQKQCQVWEGSGFHMMVVSMSMYSTLEFALMPGVHVVDYYSLSYTCTPPTYQIPP